MNTTSPNIHGHEVLALIHQAQGALTRDALIAELTRRFGPEARFCTCHDQDLTLDQLLAFLVSHGKIVDNHGRIAIDATKICSSLDGHAH